MLFPIPQTSIGCRNCARPSKYFVYVIQVKGNKQKDTILLFVALFLQIIMCLLASVIDQIHSFL